MRARSNSTSRPSLVMYDVILDPMYDDFHGGGGRGEGMFEADFQTLLTTFRSLGLRSFLPGASFSCLIFTPYCGHCRATLPRKDYLTFRIYRYFPPAASCSVFPERPADERRIRDAHT